MLKVGDVIKLENGMKVYGLIPKKFVIVNRLFSDELTKHDIVIGKEYHNTVDVSENVKNIVEQVMEAFENEGAFVSEDEVTNFVDKIVGYPKQETFVLNPGNFVVTETKSDGGGYGMGVHDVYPDGWHVTCKRLAEDGSFDKNGEEIDFYQNGSFSAVIENVKQLGFMFLEIKL